MLVSIWKKGFLRSIVIVTGLKASPTAGETCLVLFMRVFPEEINKNRKRQIESERLSFSRQKAIIQAAKGRNKKPEGGRRGSTSCLLKLGHHVLLPLDIGAVQTAGLWA